MKNILMAAIAASFAASAHAQQPIKVYAADNLRPALTEAAAGYKAAKVEFVFGNPDTLRERIVAGERPEVFASADMLIPFSLERSGLAGPTKRFARDRVCALVAPGVDVDSASLLERMLDPTVKLATATPKADQSSDYASRVFEKAERLRAGSYATLSTKAVKVSAPDSSGTYGKLISGHGADILLANCSDVREARSQNPALRVMDIPREISVSADFGMVLVQDSREEAWHLVQYLLSPNAQAVLEKHGLSTLNRGRN